MTIPLMSQSLSLREFEELLDYTVKKILSYFRYICAKYLLHEKTLKPATLLLHYITSSIVTLKRLSDVL